MTIAVKPRPVDVWLSEQPDAPLMEFPVSMALSGPSMYSTRTHGKPIPYGYGTYLPLVYRQKYPALLTFPADAALDQLAEWRVRYVLVDVDRISPIDGFTLADVQAQPRLRYVTTLDQVAVYLLDTP